ncbi:hypothetical protein LCGC14_0409270 [marine sediment metagenome]|uniref:General secretion pathway protein K n=1 Tax=marine sediment metagenome TaxID=412755 RepID=A0A0F9TCD3_9ZZZZ|nr:hypothetical protein [Phycisphaerae bacterium]HDZ44309.1 hypothetical protein [Phycisphaerae bacterium]
MKRRCRQSGYVLLIVLVVLVIATTALTSIARSCLNRSARASHLQRGLQIRWGAIGCQALVLAEPDRILRAHEKAIGEPTPVMRQTIQLGGLDFHLLLGDEQSKANVNHLTKAGDSAGMVEALQKLQEELPEPLGIELSNTESATPLPARGSTKVRSFDQVFRNSHPAKLLGLDNHADSVAGRVTFWTNGRINFRRAHPDVLKIVLDGVLSHGQVHELLAFREQSPHASVADAIRHLELSRSESRKLSAHLTETSSCHSLWVVVEDETRSWYRLYVKIDTADRSQVFAW